MKSIHASQLKEELKKNKGILLDVRNPDEHQLNHIEGAVHIPLDHVENKSHEIPRNCMVYVYCRSGNRSRQAVERLQAMGFENLINVEGGISQYQKSGGEVLRLGRGLPLMQQVQITAGTLIILGLVLAWLVNPNFIALTAFVGVGLIFAGVSGFCGMEKLLSRMPWNRTKNSFLSKKSHKVAA
ncbi:MAG: rhodanese-like domain-containing protein [Deltaproteobacteria bacterium]|nr:rhodanese-like domain-containing protein [Deltaproteobacteria bacterium]